MGKLIEDQRPSVTGSVAEQPKLVQGQRVHTPRLRTHRPIVRLVTLAPPIAVLGVGYLSVGSIGALRTRVRPWQDAGQKLLCSRLNVLCPTPTDDGRRRQGHRPYPDRPSHRDQDWGAAAPYVPCRCARRGWAAPLTLPDNNGGWPPVRYHDLRHTFASHLIVDLGLDVAQVSRILGHARITITLDVYDPGDISGGGNVDLFVLDNTGSVVSVTAPAAIRIWDIGLTRTNVGPPTPCTGSGGLTNPPTPCVVSTGSPQVATVRATSGGTTNYNGHWLRFEVPIPAAYAPGANPNNWWWSLRYQISTNVTATDTITVAIGLKGNPAHLLQS